MKTQVEQDRDWCYYHHRKEKFTYGIDYATCGECCHVYKKAKDLRKAFDRYIVGQPRLLQIFLKPTTLKIYICPLCGHDF